MDTENIYKVKAGNFEGPLDLLLSLIEQRKLFVNEISLAEVTNDYITYIKQLENQKEEQRILNISYFIIVAATLILIKSKSLLPSLSLSEDETEKIGDLERRLQFYQIIKNTSIEIKNQFGTQIIFGAPERHYKDALFSPDPQITILTISNSIKEVLQSVPKEKEILLKDVNSNSIVLDIGSGFGRVCKFLAPQAKKVISIEQMINDLTNRIQNSINTSFREFTKGRSDMDEKEIKVTFIVSFLAMLELVREGIIDVIQNNNFEDIVMNKLEEPLEQNLSVE